MRAVLSRRWNTLHLTDAYVVTICYFRVRPVWWIFTEWPHNIVVTYVLFDQLLPKNWPIWSTCSDWPLVYPGFSVSSKFQTKSDGSYWLEMLNFVISNWSEVTILNTLNPLVPIYVTLLPLSQPVLNPTLVTLGCLNGQAWLIWESSSKI